MSEEHISRRGFLGTSATVAAFTIVPRHVLGGAGQTAPSAKLNIAGIGVGGMGRSNLSQLESENIVALCDVDHAYAAGTFQKYPQAKVYTDYREMLDQEKGIDAVMIATPDHTHAVISMAAMRRGKHVYCQKPLTHDVHEARLLAQAARETGVTTQMGIQGHSDEGIRLIREWIEDGAIGEVRAVDAWCSLSYYPFGHASWSSQWSRRPQETPPVPATLNWDLWLGPAPERAYHPAYHPRVWRCWWDFGCGMMGDRGAHTLDPVVWALKLGHPTSIEATSLDLNPDIHPLASVVTYQFPARAGLPPVKLTWYEGVRAPRPPELEDGRRMGHAEGGVLFKGTKGKLVGGVYGEGPRLIPESRMQEYKLPAKTLPRVAGSHEQDWVRACKAGKNAGADFEYSGLLTEICLLGNIAKRVDARIEWDGPNLKVTNLPEANQYVRTPYRDGWTL
ncbi:MAG: Gfo/Idh/MocA family oxidoreductase [Planctomycetes bacterium]|jgi:predicted dehydrogenase|nr:Gfo/Idh/MocA family oxidoreductase [Planctomycetota bacterium]